GKEYDGWPIATYFLREKEDPQLLTMMERLNEPGAILFNVWRDAWQGAGGRLRSFVEQNITPPDGLRLDLLEEHGYRSIADDALECLNEARQHRGRALRKVTLMSGETVTRQVSPTLQFRTQLSLASSGQQMNEAIAR